MARVVLATLFLMVVPLASAHAAEPTFGEPTAQTLLGEPITLTSTISGDDIAAVDVILRLDGVETTVVVDAEPAEAASTWQVSREIDVATSAVCACLAQSQGAPNTRFSYQFRVHAADGTTTLGPVGEALVVDERFEWRTVEQGLVRVHWYSGDEEFAAAAGTVANGAIDRASELLGTTLPEPVDLFIYDTREALVEAVSPSRENIAGQAHPGIRTMFVHIPSGQSADGFAGELIRHELTHLVFDEATDNQYHAPPRWLDEGVAVYLSAGYDAYHQSLVEAAVADESLIPLRGLRGLFPARPNEFALAYGEAVAAVDFFVRTYGEPKLWELVRSYAQGLSDDEAFTRATGADVNAFDVAWFASLGLEPPEPAGPQPGPAGREPAEWGAGAPAQPSAGPVASPRASAPTAPAPTTDLTAAVVIVALIVLVIVGGIVIVIAARQYRAGQPPGPRY